MIKTFYQTFKIDLYYSVNSFLFLFKRLPILKDLLTENVYQNTLLKKIVGFFGVVVSALRAIAFKFVYFFVLYWICTQFFPSPHLSSFYHFYFFLTILGMFLNNKLLNSGKKKYFALICFQMDGTQFFHSQLFWLLLTNFLLNGIALFFFVVGVFGGSIYEAIVLFILSLSLRVIGETLNISFFRKYHYIWYSNTKIYFSILLLLLGCSALPYFSIVLPFSIIELVSFLAFVLSIFCFFSLIQMDDYLLLYKQIQKMTDVMSSQNEADYLKQGMINEKEKDRLILSKRLEKKKGYDYFNTIFFERHREILLRSARRYALFFALLYTVLAYLMIHYENYQNSIGDFLHIKLAFFIIVMFYVNRGSIITRAMFFNCDHAMLCYNFYREANVILEVFKTRLLTVVKVNLLPAVVIGIGNGVLLVLSSSWSISTIITTFFYIISLSIFFSVHYLVIYYLLQPYNKEMEAKKMGYSIVTIATFVICFWLKDIVLSSFLFSLLGVSFVLIYLLISLWLVRRFAPRTFRLH